MQIDQEACRRFWLEYLSHLPAAHAHHAATPDAFAFGGGGAIADTLADLVLAGTKRATTSMAVEFTSLGEALPVAGSVSIILRGDLAPVAVIERIDVKTLPFEEVGDEYAAIEGEGDGSLAYWRQAHIEFFGGVCKRLGGRFDERTAVICQVFRLVWPRRKVELDAY